MLSLTASTRSVYPRRDEASGAAHLEAALRIRERWFRVDAQGNRVPL
jgi:hypothetical protein